MNIRLINKIFRYKTSSACFIVGIVLTWLAIFFGVANQRELSCAIEDIKQYQYKYIDNYEICFEDETNIGFTNCGQGNCTIKAFPVSVDAANEVKLCNIIVYENEEDTMPVKYGELPNLNNMTEDENVAVLGINLKKYVASVEGEEYISINGEDYHVLAYLGSNNSTEFDEYVVLFYKSLGKNVISQMASQDNNIKLQVSIESNYYDITALQKNFIEDMSEDGLIMPLDSDEDYYSMVSVFDGSSYFWLFAYCFVICLCVSFFWVYERKKEVSIRKAFGYDSFDIARLMLLQFLSQLLLGILIAGVVSLLIQKTLLVGVITAKSTIINFVIAIMFSMLLPISSMIISLHLIVGELPINQINKEDI